MWLATDAANTGDQKHPDTPAYAFLALDKFEKAVAFYSGKQSETGC
jgi:hypothetical protein